jgi:hypothetical protein
MATNLEVNTLIENLQLAARDLVGDTQSLEEWPSLDFASMLDRVEYIQQTLEEALTMTASLTEAIKKLLVIDQPSTGGTQ